MNGKPWFKSRTVWLGVLEIAGGIAEFIAGLPAEASAATIVAGIVTIIIRFLTKQPIGRATDE